MIQRFSLLQSFRIPLLVLVGIVAYLLLNWFHFHTVALLIILASIILGSYSLFVETFQSILKKQFALDYIAILAVVVSLITKEYLVGAVIALMISSGTTLEEYGASQAKRSLTRLIDRIPRDVLLWHNNSVEKTVKIEDVTVGQHVYIRKGEVIALDGMLISKTGLTDESSLTGEPYPVEKLQGDPIRSGTINVGEPMVIEVTKESKDSTYKKIIALVEHAQGEKAPLVRLADKYSTIFTLITFVISAFAFYNFHTLESILAVLVVATPCPLIIATPIALLGGVNAAAKRRIIVKKLASIEVLARVNAIIFDKTGTITLGKPQVTKMELADKSLDKKEILAITEAIERNSLHPLAKALVQYATSEKTPILHAEDVTEQIGKGISGKVNGKTYTLSKATGQQAAGMTIELWGEKKRLASFVFEDEMKSDAKDIVASLKHKNISLALYTGDKKEAAHKLVKDLDKDITVQAECTPEDKRNGIEELKRQRKITAMIGDGINDAPALALADVGMVFSSEEQTAATDAADIVFLGGSFALVNDSLAIARRTIGIAMQSILVGIGLSIGAMILASLGIIPPLLGAGIQEAIDVAVIINALRAAA